MLKEALLWTTLLLAIILSIVSMVVVFLV